MGTTPTNQTSNQTPTQKPNNRLDALLYAIYMLLAFVFLAISHAHNSTLLTLAAVFTAVAAINAFYRRSWWQFGIAVFAIVGLLLVISEAWKVGA